MKIALLGYGKMGKTIEKIAIDRGHEIVLKISDNIETYDLSLADVAIDFSIPTAALINITACCRNHLPIISGTTGWLNNYHQAVKVCEEENSAFLYASNFSIGVNLFFDLNEKLARLMQPFKEYAVAIEEIHHTQKLDAPSGTAISLADQIVANSSLTGWKAEQANDNELPVYSKRIDDVPGTHTVFYTSPADTIEIKHTAHSRQGFARGAVIAAEWIRDKKGVFSMKDVLSGLK